MSRPIVLREVKTFTNHTFTTPIIITNNKVKLINCRSEGTGRSKNNHAVVIACDDYVLESHTCRNVGVGIIAAGKNNTVKNCDISNFYEDAIRFCKDGAKILGNVITEYIGPKGAHHKDCIQFYSGAQDTRFSHRDMNVFKHVLRDCVIENNIMISDSNCLQGIFSSDGMVADMLIKNNYIVLPNANHSISVRGMVRGMSRVEGNYIEGAQMRIQCAKNDENGTGKGGPTRVIIEDNDMKLPPLTKG